MNTLSRRGFLAASAAAFAAARFPRAALAQATAPLGLSAETRTLDINGRAATVFGLAGPSGQGLALEPGQRFRVDLTNNLDVGTIIHWHGQIPPNAQDGVPDMPMPMLQPGETRSYDFAPLVGTYWMHSHVPMQEMRLLAAPLIVRSSEDVVMLGGAMRPYVWTINGAVWGRHRPVTARSGERVVLSFHNMSMMAHPMHLHGHVFQVVGLNGRAVSGAVRDTVHVPPMTMVDVALDAGEAARWMLHCHHMPHLETGMMTEFSVSA